MKSLGSWLILMFMGMFLAFRGLVAYKAEFGETVAGIFPYDQKIEIILLFVVLVCIILIAKRMVVGSLIYFIAYGIYFGMDCVTIVTKIFSEGFSATYGLQGIVALIGFILPLVAFLDIMAEKTKLKTPLAFKTDWYYKNNKYERDDLDQRRDKNNYKLY